MTIPAGWDFILLLINSEIGDVNRFPFGDRSKFSA